MSESLAQIIHELIEAEAEYRKALQEYWRLVYHDGNPNKPKYRHFREDWMRCPICEKRVKRRHGNQKYCSDLCRQRAYLIRSGKRAEAHWKDCSECGAGFVAKHPSRLTCSPRCRKDRRNRLQRRLWHHSGRTFECDCMVCGQAFVSAIPHAKYCAEICRKEATNARRRETYARKQSDKAIKTVDRVCVMCGGAFKAQRKSAVYCGKRCSRDAYNITRREKRRKIPHP